MKSDLIELNLRIGKRIGISANLMTTYSSYLSVCVGRLSISSAELVRLTTISVGVANPLDVIYINRDYLNYARMIAQSIVGAGDFSGLLVLGVDLEQARVLSRLSNQQITLIAKYADGEVFRFISPVRNLNHFQSTARPHFAAALIAA